MKDKLIAEERMKQFGRDVLHWINYDYVVINDNLNDCYNKIDNSKLSFLDNIFTKVVFPAPDGEDKTNITPSFSEGI